MTIRRRAFFRCGALDVGRELVPTRPVPRPIGGGGVFSGAPRARPVVMRPKGQHDLSLLGASQIRTNLRSSESPAEMERPAQHSRLPALLHGWRSLLPILTPAPVSMTLRGRRQYVTSQQTSHQGLRINVPPRSRSLIYFRHILAGIDPWLWLTHNKARHPLMAGKPTQSANCTRAVASPGLCFLLPSPLAPRRSLTSGIAA